MFLDSLSILTVLCLNIVVAEWLNTKAFFKHIGTGFMMIKRCVFEKMMEEHKGNIWVDSEGKGRGSVFCIELPEFKDELPK